MRLPQGSGPISTTLRRHDAALKSARLLPGPNQNQVNTPSGVIISPKGTATGRRAPVQSNLNVWR